MLVLVSYHNRYRILSTGQYCFRNCLFICLFLLHPGSVIREKFLNILCSSFHKAIMVVKQICQICHALFDCLLYHNIVMIVQAVMCVLSRALEFHIFYIFVLF